MAILGTFFPKLLVLAIIAFAIIMFVLVAAHHFIAPAHAHDWYPTECCHELQAIPGSTSFRGDCGVADVVGSTPAGIVLKQRETGLVVTIGPDFPKHKIHQNTHDTQWHVCAVPMIALDGFEGGTQTTPASNEPHVYCVFEPQFS